MLSSLCNFITSLVSRRPEPVIIATLVEEPAPRELKPMQDYFPSNDAELAEICRGNMSRARQEEFASRYPRTMEEFHEKFGFRSNPAPTPVRAIPPPAYPRTEVVQSRWLPPGALSFQVTRDSPHSGEMTPFIPEPVEQPSDDEGNGSPKFGCWAPPTVGQTWPERLESLTQRADAVGMDRIADNLYAIRGFRSVVRVDEKDRHMLFPGEMPSRQPHFHGLRYMTEAEMDEETKKRPLDSDDNEEGSKRARK